MDENNVKLMQKKFADLTVGDYVKLNLGTLAIMAAIPVGMVVVDTAKSKVADWKHNRRLKNVDTDILDNE